MPRRDRAQVEIGLPRGSPLRRFGGGVEQPCVLEIPRPGTSALFHSGVGLRSQKHYYAGLHGSTRGWETNLWLSPEPGAEILLGGMREENLRNLRQLTTVRSYSSQRGTKT